MKKATLYKVLIITMSLLLVCAVAYILVNKSENKPPTIQPDTNAVEWDGEQQINRLPNGQKGIAIPGFKSLILTANQTKQRVNFYNPDTNDCLFQMTLFVDDKQLWESGYCAAGQGYYNIELTQGLLVGTYSGSLQIQCLKSDGTALNSANVKFEVIVQEDNS